jgi:hypothetical protein
MGHPKLVAILEANIDNYWREFNLAEFEQILVEMEKDQRLTPTERESLLLYLGLKKLSEEPNEGDDASPLQP